MFSLLSLFLSSNHHTTAGIVFFKNMHNMSPSCLKFSRAFPLYLGGPNLNCLFWPQTFIICSCLLLHPHLIHTTLPHSPCFNHIRKFWFHKYVKMFPYQCFSINIPAACNACPILTIIIEFFWAFTA